MGKPSTTFKSKISASADYFVIVKARHLNGAGINITVPFMVPPPVIVTAFPFGSANALEAVGGFAVREDQNHLIVSGTIGQDIPCSLETGLNIGTAGRSNTVNRVLYRPIRVGEVALHLASLLIADYGDTVLTFSSIPKHNVCEIFCRRFCI